MQPDLHPFEMLFYAKLVGMVTSRSRDKDGGHNSQAAIAKNPMLHTNINLSSTEILPIEVCPIFAMQL